MKGLEDHDFEAFDPKPNVGTRNPDRPGNKKTGKAFGNGYQLPKWKQELSGYKPRVASLSGVVNRDDERIRTLVRSMLDERVAQGMPRREGVSVIKKEAQNVGVRLPKFPDETAALLERLGFRLRVEHAPQGIRRYVSDLEVVP